MISIKHVRSWRLLRGRRLDFWQCMTDNKYVPATCCVVPVLWRETRRCPMSGLCFGEMIVMN